jgi:class 3 adenylate cyclase/predicted ATPase
MLSFIETVERARAVLKRNGRLSLRALKREFDLDDDALEELSEELVDVQQVATLDGKVLSWISPAGATATVEAAASEPEVPATSTAPTATASAVQATAPAVEAPAAQADEGERRQLTVMFCDLVGSTALSEQLDPEDTRTLIRGYQEIAAAAIERFGGHLAKYIGDGIMAYFGYPQAHEDDAERSVRAGLEIRDRLPDLNERVASVLAATRERRISTRIGIHTGMVVAAEMGAGARRERLAIVGDTPNIAARLEGIAESDSVVISDATLRLVPGMFLMKDLGSPALKGIAEPVRAYAVLQSTGVRSRLDVDPSKLTPLVGRDQEVGLLLDRWEHAQEGEGQVVLIAGEAGLGKSRLIQAFRQRLAGTPHSWLECRCTPYTQGSPLQPAIELLEQGLGFKPGDDPAAKLDRLERGVERAGGSLPEVVPLIASLLSIPLGDRYSPLQLSPELQRKKTMEALVAWPIGLGEQQPLVMLYEDLHWSDPSTVELLGLAIEQHPKSHVLTILTFRPGFESPWPARSHLTNVAVNRLSGRQTRNMIGGMTRNVPLPDGVVDRIVERADGVPIFVEEVTKMVLESGLVEEREGRYELVGSVTELPIPATLQDSLMARIDRLETGKEVAQLGAALGREFLYELLRSVSPLDDPALQAGLARLVDAELLYQRGALPEATYTFKHAMIQDTAYQSLLKSARRQFHTRIAQVLEEQFPERALAEPAVIAHHCDQAGLAAEAIAHYGRAGERAAEQSANKEAIGYLKRALELVGTLPESDARHQQEIGLQMAIAAPLSAARGWGDPECEGAFTRARELASQIGDVPDLTLVLAGLASSLFTKGDLTASAEAAQQGLEASELSNSTLDLIFAHNAMGMPLYWQGEFSRALHHLEQVIRLYDPAVHASFAYTTGSDRGVTSRAYAAWCHYELGYADRALASSQDAVALARQVEHPVSLAFALSWAAVQHWLRRELDRTQECADEAIVLGERLGFPLYVGLSRALRGLARALAGEGEGGVAEMQQALGALAQTGTGIGAPALLIMLAEGSWQIGRHDDALGALAFAFTRAQTGQHFRDAALHRLKAEILLDQDEGQADEAEALLREAIEIAQRQEAKSWELRAATSLARLWQRQGKRAEARDLLQPVYDWFTEGFDTQDLKDAKALLEELA